MMPSLHHRAADHLRGVLIVECDVVAGTVNADLLSSFATRLIITRMHHRRTFVTTLLLLTLLVASSSYSLRSSSPWGLKIAIVGAGPSGVLLVHIVWPVHDSL